MPFGFGKSSGGDSGKGEIHIDMSAGKNPPSVPPGAKVVGPDWLAWMALCKHLQGEGINPGKQDNVAQLGIPGVACTVRLDDSYDGVGPTIPLWFDVTLPGVNLTIRESLASPAQGEGPDAVFGSIQDSVHFFARGSLAAIRNMYRMGKRGDGVSRGQITSITGGAATTWGVVVGPPLPMITTAGRTEEVRAALAGNGLFVAAFCDSLVGVLREQRAHWVKILLTQRADGERQVFMSLDNDTQQLPPERMSGVALPAGVLAMCRQFAIVYPESTKKQAGSDDPRTVARLKLDGVAGEISATSAS